MEENARAALRDTIADAIVRADAKRVRYKTRYRVPFWARLVIALQIGALLGAWIVIDELLSEKPSRAEHMANVKIEPHFR